MNMIDEQYKSAKVSLETLKAMRNENGNEPPMTIDTFHFITPQSEKGMELIAAIYSFAEFIQEKGAIPIRVFGKDIDIDELEKVLYQSITVSKKNIQDMIIKHKLVDKMTAIEDQALVNSLNKDSLPQ